MIAGFNTRIGKNCLLTTNDARARRCGRRSKQRDSVQLLWKCWTSSKANRTRRTNASRDRTLLSSTMSASTGDKITVVSPADFHVHLRQGKLSQLVTPHVRLGGFDLAYVMVRNLP